MRQIVLDTETTGLEVNEGHRIIEIGCVEIVKRKLTGRHFHQYINPQRDSDEGALEVHGITNEFLSDKPLFESIASEFLEFIDGAELIIHNAPFDIGFIESEFKLLNQDYPSISSICSIVDTVRMARKLHPGQKNNLNALCKRYGVDNSQRELHGALLDAEILADVYLLMTGGQTHLQLDANHDELIGASHTALSAVFLNKNRKPLRIIKATKQELIFHQKRLEKLKNEAGSCLWLDLEAASEKILDS